MRANKAKAKTKKTADNEENAERKRDMWIKLKRMGVTRHRIARQVKSDIINLRLYVQPLFLPPHYGKAHEDTF